MIEKIKFERFTAFEDLELKFSPGINLFVGENGTGKTHILKAIYAACDITQSKKNFAEKITRVFLPTGMQTGRLVKRTKGSTAGSLEVTRTIHGKSCTLKLAFSNHASAWDYSNIKLTGTESWKEEPMESVYIPVKDMMANAPGFRSLYTLRDIHFEEVYADIIDRAFRSSLRGPTDKIRKSLMDILQNAIEGKVITKNEEFFLKNKQGELEFTLLAEGIRKLALLWVLIQNGTLLNGSVLFWDEPETNLNPKLMRIAVEILIALQRMGVQIFLTTHDYIILKEFDLQANETDKVLFHSLYRNKETQEIEVATTDTYLNISPNAIDDTFGGLIDREIQKSMGDLGK